jgi:hypothetical protein
MLWYKAWFETRWRFVFVIGSILVTSLIGPLLSTPPNVLWIAIRIASLLLYCFSALYLAGAGINVQTTYSLSPGFHGSMLFTLSLPVSRRRLFFVRAGLGAIETCVCVTMMAGITLLFKPGGASVLQAIVYETRVIACSMTIYAMSALLACVLDEVWQFNVSVLCVGAIWLLQSHSVLVSHISPLRCMSLVSYPLTAPMPWTLVSTSLIITGLLLYASALVLQRKEY